MKKLLMLLVTALCPYIYMAAETLQSPDSDTKEIDLEKITLNPGSGGQNIPRSIYYLKAYYHANSSSVEIIHEDLESADIYIIDSSNYVVSRLSVYSSDYSIDTLDAPLNKGTYTLIIDSRSIYACGDFVVR